jgi:hypothetical protein
MHTDTAAILHELKEAWASLKQEPEGAGASTMAHEQLGGGMDEMRSLRERRRFVHGASSCSPLPLSSRCNGACRPVSDCLHRGRLRGNGRDGEREPPVSWQANVPAFETPLGSQPTIASLLRLAHFFESVELMRKMGGSPLIN